MPIYGLLKDGSKKPYRCLRDPIVKLSPPLPITTTFDDRGGYYFELVPTSEDQPEFPTRFIDLNAVSPISSQSLAPSSDDADLGVAERLDDDSRIQMRAIKERKGQGKFRRSLLTAYNQRCAVTGSETEQILEAAHIVPHSTQTDDRTSNGLLLRADIHTLFDLSLLTIDTNYRIQVSKVLRSSECAAYDNALLYLPKCKSDRPDRTGLRMRIKEFLDHEQGS